MLATRLPEIIPVTTPELESKLLLPGVFLRLATWKNLHQQHLARSRLRILRR
jgi:hypothetical protein